MRCLSQSHKSFRIALNSVNNEMAEHRSNTTLLDDAAAEITFTVTTY
jgi:hypothetical protein